jgi:hypothetical protein
MINRGHIRKPLFEVFNGAQHILVLLGEAQAAQVFNIANKNAFAQFIKSVLQAAPRILVPAGESLMDCKMCCLTYLSAFESFNEDTNITSLSVKLFRTISLQQRRTRASMSALKHNSL